eukprot:TRINITY_DN29102_c0_g1_i1.p1 TRINITY_DN29102_c0_g1~~TRINITY_DN29102_c0_g1_i1.p1  ORF type:complete len:150 (+),score=55.65 TRINITY_DN29102_c0_g1_i1:111-560(+)
MCIRDRVKRGECNFVTKVLNLQEAYAVAVVVYDNIEEGWIYMAMPDGARKPDIPSVFIKMVDGEILKSFLAESIADATKQMDATLMQDNENSMRLTINDVQPTADPKMSLVFGVVETRRTVEPVSYTHLRAHETVLDLVCRLLLEKKKK